MENVLPILRINALPYPVICGSKLNDVIEKIQNGEVKKKISETLASA